MPPRPRWCASSAPASDPDGPAPAHVPAAIKRPLISQENLVSSFCKIITGSYDGGARPASSVLELRRTFLDERRHAFLLILGREQRVEHAAFEADAFGERGLVGAVDALLG